MKSSERILVAIILILILPGCRMSSFKGENCSLSSGNVTFTKSLNNAALISSVMPDGKILIRSGPGTDFFNEPDGSARYANAPVLLTEVDNKIPFTFTVRVIPEADTTYDAGALYLYSDDNLWHKFAFEMDERGFTRLVTVRTMGTSDDNNHDRVVENFLFMKISSDTRSVGFYYSPDSINWQLVRVYRNNYPAKIWIGISSQSPVGKGILTTFDDCILSKKSIGNFRLGI